MSQGTLFAYTKERKHSRAITPKAIINYFDLDVKIAECAGKVYEDNFPLRKAPAFVGPKGFKLQEVMAIILYLMNLGDPKSKLLGKNPEEYAGIIKWMSIVNAELLPTLANAFRPILGKLPYNKRSVDEAITYSDKVVSLFEKRLMEYTYLVGERLTIADIFVASLVTRGFDYLWGIEWRKQHPAFTRWFKTIIQNPILFDVIGEYKFRDIPIEYVPPKKEKKAEKEHPKKETSSNNVSQVEEPTVTPKPKHPLEALGKPKAPLDEWKRIYSNEETRETAIPWFWETQYDPEEWSLWKVDYKYNDELTLTFMSNNLVGGFFNRLSASSKYIFGCMVVYGENNNNGITGVFLVRGQDYMPAFNVAPDWESYSFTKLDPTFEETKRFVNNMLAWDEPVEVNGELREIVDGKVCK